MKTVSREQALSSYQWGTSCEAWNFVAEPSLSVKLERMPAGSSEELHYHQQAQQFFFITRGVAGVVVEGHQFTLQTGEGLHVKAGEKHRIFNASAEVLEFLITSQPAVINDRFPG